MINERSELRIQLKEALSKAALWASLGQHGIAHRYRRQASMIKNRIDLDMMHERQYYASVNPVNAHALGGW